MVQWRWRPSFVLLLLFVGVAVHNVLDAMWLHPEIFLYPLYGWKFITPMHEAWVGEMTIGALKVSKT
jgi:hypothetical protein